MLLLGPPGAGKSDLLLRLLDREEWRLVADDQVLLSSAGGGLSAAAPAMLSGMIEVRGLGLLEGLETACAAPLRLTVVCVGAGEVPRLPSRRTWTCPAGVLPMLVLDPFPASSPRKVELALLAVEGRLRCRAGAFGPV